MDSLMTWLDNDYSTTSVLLYLFASTHLTIVAVTVYLHRCQAHRALALHPLPSHLFRLWLWLSTGMVTREWVAVHRCHHARCETKEDPHSPQVNGIRAVLWRGTELYRAAAGDPALVARFGTGTPDDWVERQIYSRFTWQGVGLMLIADVYLFGAIGLTVWAVQMLWIPVCAAGIVNGIGHFWGYRNFDCAEAAKNIVPWGILIGGEELHNNHHAYPASARMSRKWYEVDLGWIYIRLLCALGLANVRAPPQPLRLGPAGGEPQLVNLAAVLSHRAEVMGALARQLRTRWQTELRRVGDNSAQRRTCLQVLARDPGYLNNAQQRQLSRLLRHNGALAELHAMRQEFVRLWDRSRASNDELLEQLRNWTRRANRSEYPELRAFSRMLSSWS